MESFLVDPRTFHLTLSVLCLSEGLEEEKRVVAALSLFDIGQDRHGKHLDFTGIGHFGSNVFYASPTKETSTFEWLLSMQQRLCEHMTAHGVYVLKKREFEPHVSLSTKTRGGQGSNTPHPSVTKLTSAFKSIVLGSQHVQTIQMCRMGVKPGGNGYYTVVGELDID